eukprot:1148648-Pelagomonas_calceolata.AAC.8
MERPCPSICLKLGCLKLGCPELNSAWAGCPAKHASCALVSPPKQAAAEEMPRSTNKRVWLPAGMHLGQGDKEASGGGHRASARDGWGLGEICMHKCVRARMLQVTATQLPQMEGAPSAVTIKRMHVIKLGMPDRCAFAYTHQKMQT